MTVVTIAQMQHAFPQQKMDDYDYKHAIKELTNLRNAYDIIFDEYYCKIKNKQSVEAISLRQALDCMATRTTALKKLLL